MEKKFIAVTILSLALLLNSAPPGNATELDDALARQGKIQVQKKQYQDKLNQLTFTADKIKAQLAQLDAQAAQAEKDLKEKQAATDKARTQLSAAQKELAAKQKEADSRRQALAARVRSAYEDTPISYLDILVQADSLDDLLSRLEYLKILVQNDQHLLAQTRSAIQEVGERTKQLQTLQEQAVQLQAQAQAAKADLDTKRGQKQVLLAGIEKDAEEEGEEVEKLAAQAQEWQAKIRRLQAANKSGVKGSITTWPLPDYYEISSPFGWRINPITKKGGVHEGIDIPAPTGTAILAAASGTVIFAGWDDVYGYYTVVDIGGGTATTYGHQSKLGISVGQKVQAGQVVGYVGSTGWSTGAHLDFGVAINGKKVDPLPYFK